MIQLLGLTVILQEPICFWICRYFIWMEGWINCNLTYCQQQKQHISQMLKTQPLVAMFKDESFAWSLLESEILIQTTQEPDGQDISKLLQLYMRGVQVMNISLDPRESYFRSKVTALMAKNTVRKTFKSKQQLQTKKVEPIKQEKPSEEVTVVSKKQLLKKNSEGLVSSTVLHQKKKELELRLAYATQQHNPQGLRKIIAKNKESEIKIVTKVQKIIDSHEQRLKERINKRKLKTATYRSKAEDRSQSLQAIEDHDSAQANVNIPINTQNKTLKAIPEIIQESPTKSNERRLYKSAETKFDRSNHENSQKEEQGNEKMKKSRKHSINLI